MTPAEQATIPTELIVKPASKSTDQTFTVSKMSQGSVNSVNCNTAHELQNVILQDTTSGYLTFQGLDKVLPFDLTQSTAVIQEPSIQNLILKYIDPTTGPIIVGITTLYLYSPNFNIRDIEISYNGTDWCGYLVNRSGSPTHSVPVPSTHSLPTPPAPLNPPLPQLSGSSGSNQNPTTLLPPCSCQCGSNQ